jgi:23S rRNA (cytidine1920-2'-O)/16S rRNA (cytidine1409-2'-O)-methyltransferase
MPEPRVRLDQRLVELGLDSTRSRARQRIRAGQVQVDGRTVTRPGALVSRQQRPALRAGPRYVSRGGDKLAAALDQLGVDPGGLHCIDVGAGTGGFTDCLLQRGAHSVLALDVGHGQLAPALRADPRVQCLEGTSIRDFSLPSGAQPAELLVADLAFLSLTKVWTALRALVRSGGRLLVLVKPQFELEPAAIGRTGVVRDPGLRERALAQVRAAAAADGLRWLASCPAPVLEERGNREVFALLERGE